MAKILRRLYCVAVEVEDALTVTPPSFRFDLGIEADFVEEIARVFGYDKVPATPPKSTVPILRISETTRSRSASRRSRGAAPEPCVHYLSGGKTLSAGLESTGPIVGVRTHL